MVADYEDAMAEKTGANFFDLVRGAFWPAAALVITFAFYNPIYKVVDAISLRASSIQKIKLGELELNIKVSELPVPTTETARVLPRFNERMIVELINMTGDNGPCFRKGVSRATDPRFDAFSALAELKLIDLNQANPSTSVCEITYEAKLTADGRATRKFLMDFLATQVTSLSRI